VKKKLLKMIKRHYSVRINNLTKHGAYSFNFHPLNLFPKN
jgi:hypothetical protein